MFDLLPPIDVGDPEAFITATITIFTGYPMETMDAAVPVIAQRTERPTLKLIKAVCEEVYAPLERRIEREMAARSHRIALPPPRHERTPKEQVRVDAQVADAYAKIGLPVPKQHIPPQQHGDGRHAARVAADLAARKARAEPNQD